jgi:hypothetical protein
VFECCCFPETGYQDVAPDLIRLFETKFERAECSAGKIVNEEEVLTMKTESPVSRKNEQEIERMLYLAASLVVAVALTAGPVVLWIRWI